MKQNFLLITASFLLGVMMLLSLEGGEMYTKKRLYRIVEQRGKHTDNSRVLDFEIAYYEKKIVMEAAKNRFYIEMCGKESLTTIVMNGKLEIQDISKYQKNGIGITITDEELKNKQLQKEQELLLADTQYELRKVAEYLDE